MASDTIIQTDKALELRRLWDQGVELPEKEALQKLGQSPLVKRLTGELIDKPLYYIWRILALSEIPYAGCLDYTKDLISRIYKKLAVPFGFSLSGDEKMFLPCYNAMLVSALSRLEHASDKEVENAVKWINDYQPMQRWLSVSAPELKFDRYGGCFKQCPCYIGVVKSTMALIEYEKSSGNTAYHSKKDDGIEYILQHHLYKRLSNGKPITRNILKITFPESYHVTILELIGLISRAGKLNDERAGDAIKYLLEIKKDGWKINYRYKSEGYIVFDEGNKNNDWINYLIDYYLNNKI